MSEKICPRCGEKAYVYGHSYSEDAHWFYCRVCNYENHKETRPDIQSLSLSPELRKLVELKDGLKDISSGVFKLQNNVIQFIRETNQNVGK